MLTLFFLACSPVASVSESSDRDSGSEIEAIPTTPSGSPPPSSQPASEPSSSPTDTGASTDTASTSDTAQTNDTSSSSEICTDPADMDCDGVLTAEDCNDNDPSLLAVALDANCDGLCDSSGVSMTEDGDCDGVLAAQDCNNSDPASTVVAEDGDCDGVSTPEDCNDTDPLALSFLDDADCDGVSSADDCDDTDNSLLDISNDTDCDGLLIGDDCDDANPASTAVAEDGDCDGVLTAEDCNDADSSFLSIANDADCDGLPYTEDCNDADPADTSVCASGFNECVSDWCVQAGTLDQATKCNSSSSDGLTCYDPVIRYGTTEGGHPCEHSGNDYEAWCQQLGFSGYTVHTTSSMSVAGKLFGCTSYDEFTWHWCDWQDGSWLNSSLNSSGLCDYVSSVSCY